MNREYDCQVAQSVVPLVDRQFLMDSCLEGNMKELKSFSMEVRSSTALFGPFYTLWFLTLFYFFLFVSRLVGEVDHVKHVIADLSSKIKKAASQLEESRGWARGC